MRKRKRQGIRVRDKPEERNAGSEEVAGNQRRKGMPGLLFRHSFDG